MAGLTQRQFETLKRQIENEYQEKLDALYVLAGKQRNRKAEPKAPEAPEPKLVKSATPTVAVDELLAELGGGAPDRPTSAVEAVRRAVHELRNRSHFTVPDVHRFIVERWPDMDRNHFRPTISNYLSRMTESGKLKVVQEAQGKDPKRYSYVVS